MDEMRQQIQRKLVANILIDKCSQSSSLIFKESWCSQERIVRFTTPFFRDYFQVKENNEGKWNTGDYVMYEAYNEYDSISVKCIIDISYLPYSLMEQGNKLIEASKAKRSREEVIILKEWTFENINDDINKTFEEFDHLINFEIPEYESKLTERIKEEKIEDQIREGAAEYVTTNKYERNPKARTACLEYYGTSCAVCGLDFGKEYGPEFAEKIEVHHIVPLSEIGEEYIVDPIKDLVPVCPNCHSALHSKKGGVYTIEELKAIRAKNK